MDRIGAINFAGSIVTIITSLFFGAQWNIQYILLIFIIMNAVGLAIGLLSSIAKKLIKNPLQRAAFIKDRLHITHVRGLIELGGSFLLIGLMAWAVVWQKAPEYLDSRLSAIYADEAKKRALRVVLDYTPLRQNIKEAPIEEKNVVIAKVNRGSFVGRPIQGILFTYGVEKALGEPGIEQLANLIAVLTIMLMLSAMYVELLGMSV